MDTRTVGFYGGTYLKDFIESRAIAEVPEIEYRKVPEKMKARAVVVAYASLHN
jgi:hypothetical protein